MLANFELAVRMRKQTMSSNIDAKSRLVFDATLGALKWWSPVEMLNFINGAVGSFIF